MNKAKNTTTQAKKLANAIKDKTGFMPVLAEGRGTGKEWRKRAGCIVKDVSREAGILAFDLYDSFSGGYIHTLFPDTVKDYEKMLASNADNRDRVIKCHTIKMR